MPRDGRSEVAASPARRRTSEVPKAMAHLDLRGRILGLSLAALAIAFGHACIAAPTPNRTPATTVCGTTLDASAAGALMYDIGSDQEYPTVAALSAGDRVYVKVSDSCQVGVTVALVPSDTFEIVKSARASDGSYAAVVLKPERLAPTKLTAMRNGQTVGTLEIDLNGG